MKIHLKPTKDREGTLCGRGTLTMNPEFLTIQAIDCRTCLRRRIREFQRAYYEAYKTLYDAEKHLARIEDRPMHIPGMERVKGEIWCDTHCCVHPESFDPYEEGSDDTGQLPCKQGNSNWPHRGLYTLAPGVPWS